MPGASKKLEIHQLQIIIQTITPEREKKRHIMAEYKMNKEWLSDVVVKTGSVGWT